jgi:PAS domain S-box-containing protein
VTNERQGWPRLVGINLALAIIYFGAARFGLSLSVGVKQVTAVWPPSGISLAALLIYGYGAAPGIVFGAFAANFAADESLPVAATIAIGNTLEALLGTLLLRRFNFDTHIDRRRDVVGLVFLAALLSTLVSAILGATNLCIGHIVPWESFSSTWRTWWIGDAMGELVITPLLLTWIIRPLLPWKGWTSAHVCLFTALIIVCYVVFAARMFEANPYFRLAYVVFPFAICAAIYFGQCEAALAVFIISSFAIWGTVHQTGPFAAQQVDERLISLQLFMAVIAVTTLLLGALTGERRRTENLLRESEAAKSNILSSALDPIVSIDDSGRIIECNPALEQLFGFQKKEIMGKPITEIIAHTGHKKEPFRVADVVTGTKLGRLGETVVKRPDGSEMCVDLVITAAGPKSFALFLHDISEQKNAQMTERAYQDQLRALVSEISNEEELRRRRFATSVQEEIGETLVFMQSKLEAVRAQVQHPDLVNSTSVLDQLVVDTRNLASDFSPPVLYDQGLGPPLRWLTEMVQTKYELACSFEDDGQSKPVKEELRIAVFQAVRELLLNCVNHAKAKVALVSISRAGPLVLVKVIDNGIGFTPPVSPKGEDRVGRGLFFIRERLAHLGGRINIESEKGKGSQITLEVPCDLKPS